MSSQLTVSGQYSVQIGSQIRLERNGNLVDHFWTGNACPNSGAFTVSRVFNCKKGDKIIFRAWNWDTNKEVKVTGAILVIQEI